MSYPSMRAVEALGVSPVKLPHPFCQVRLRRFRHLAPGVTYPVEALAYLPKHFQPCLSVMVWQVNILPPVAMRGDMVNATGEYES
jgi:hypothetical protein